MHSDAPTAADTDWRQILALYDQLLAVTPTPVVALNRAVALAEVDGPGIALATVDELDLDAYGPFHVTRADLLARLGRREEASAAYDRALVAHGQRGRAPVPPRAPQRPRGVDPRQGRAKHRLGATATGEDGGMPEPPASYRFYGDLAEWWPLISPPEDYAEEAAFAATMLASASIPVREVLELGSGGGHNAVHLKAHVLA